MLCVCTVHICIVAHIGEIQNEVLSSSGKHTQADRAQPVVDRTENAKISVFWYYWFGLDQFGAMKFSNTEPKLLEVIEQI